MNINKYLVVDKKGRLALLNTFTYVLPYSSSTSDLHTTLAAASRQWNCDHACEDSCCPSSTSAVSGESEISCSIYMHKM